MTSLIKVSGSGPLGSLVGFKGVQDWKQVDQINSPCQTMQSSPNLVKIWYNIYHKKLKPLKKIIQEVNGRR